MKASEARKLGLSQKVEGLDLLLKYIKKDAAEFSTTVAGSLIKGDSVKIVTALRKLGYTAAFIGDSRDGDYYKIEW
jgi:hypothetical protein